MNIIDKGIELEDHEAEIWRKADSNDLAWCGPTSRRLRLSGRELRALPHGFTPEELGEEFVIPRRIFPEAYDALDKLIIHYEELLDSGLLVVNYLKRNRCSETAKEKINGGGEPVSVLAVNASLGIALELQEAISEQCQLAPAASR
jgi:hypothetical protein